MRARSQRMRMTWELVTAAIQIALLVHVRTGYMGDRKDWAPISS